LQQGTAARAIEADAEKALTRRIDGDDQEISVKNDRAAVQIVDDVTRQRVPGGTVRCFVARGRPTQRLAP
jgi:hypothetical protein